MNICDIKKECERNNNLWKIVFMPWRYPVNWIENIKLFFRTIKWSIQRARRGYSDWDCWNLDTFYSNLISASLIQLAYDTYGYPGTTEFPTYESWIDALLATARLMYQSSEYNDYYKNDLSLDCKIENNKLICDSTEEERKAYLNKELDMAAMRKADFELAWKWLGEHFGQLWN